MSLRTATGKTGSFSVPPLAALAIVILPALVAAAASGLGSEIVWAMCFSGIVLATLLAGWLPGTVALALGLAVLALRTGADARAFLLFGACGAAQVAGFAWLRARFAVREKLHERLLRLVDAAQGFVFFADREGRPLEPVPGFSELTGLSWQAYCGHGWLEAVHAEDRPLLPWTRGDDSDVFHFEIRLRDRNDAWRWHRMRIVPVRDGEAKVIEWVGTLRDIHERKLAAERRDLVLAEARHRLKNLMAIIEALAKYSAPRPGTEPAVDEFLRRFNGRLHALTAASDLALSTGNTAIEARTAIREVLAPFMGEMGSRIRLAGPELKLKEDLGGGLAMAVHELATNAIKYGALSVPEGTVAFVWSSVRDGAAEHILFDWKESGGPPPEPPDREGFGLRMIKSVTQREKDGEVRLDYEPDGLRCRISVTRAA